MNQSIPACLAAGRDAFPAGLEGSMIGQSTNAGHKELEGKGYQVKPHAKSYIYKSILSYYLVCYGLMYFFEQYAPKHDLSPVL